MAGLGETLTRKRPVGSKSSATSKVTWLSETKPNVAYGHRERPALVGGCRKRIAALWDFNALARLNVECQVSPRPDVRHCSNRRSQRDGGGALLITPLQPTLGVLQTGSLP